MQHWMSIKHYIFRPIPWSWASWAVSPGQFHCRLQTSSTSKLWCHLPFFSSGQGHSESINTVLKPETRLKWDNNITVYNMAIHVCVVNPESNLNLFKCLTNDGTDFSLYLFTCMTPNLYFISNNSLVGIGSKS